MPTKLTKENWPDDENGILIPFSECFKKIGFSPIWLFEELKEGRIHCYSKFQQCTSSIHALKNQNHYALSLATITQWLRRTDVPRYRQIEVEQAILRLSRNNS